MSIERKRIFLAASLATALGGCAIDQQTGELASTPATPELGEASRQTFMAQVVDPDPKYDTLVPESSGDQAARAIQAYREGSVKEPVRISTSIGSGSSSGSSGSK